MTIKELERRVKDLERRCCCANEVLFNDSFADFPETGTTGKIYVDEETGLLYRWDGNSYEVVGGSGSGGGGLSYFEDGIDLVSLTVYTITHSLDLQDPNSYIVSFKDSAGEPLEIDYSAVDENTIEVLSAVNISNISVTVLGL